MIGGGIGGLTAAIYAARAGFEVKLYERHGLVGGECTGWDRQGCHIDNCVHWLMGAAPGSEMNRLWQTVGALGPGVEVLRFESMYTSELGGERLTLWADGERTRREMIALSPRDENEINRLMDSCRLARDVRIPAAKPPELMGAGDYLKMALTMGAAMKLFKRYRGQDIQDLMNRFTHPLLRALIGDFCTRESMAHSFPMAYGNFLSGDGGIPRGGSRAMALRMMERLQALGAEVFAGQAVERILTREGRATGLELATGEKVEGDYIIPACDTFVTFSKLLPERYMPDLLRRMYGDRQAYPVYTTFQAAFDLAMGEELIGPDLMLECPPLMDGMGGRITLKSYAYEPTFAPAGHQVVQAMAGGPEGMYDVWMAMDQAAYRETKREMAVKVQSLIEARFPQTKGRLNLLDSWTSRTYQRYTGAYKGFYQAFTLTKRSEPTTYLPALLNGLDGVVLAGQWLNPPGGLPGAAIAGKYAVQRILHREGRNSKI